MKRLKAMNASGPVAILLSLLAALAVANAAAAPAAPPAPAPAAQAPAVATAARPADGVGPTEGVASWYGAEFHGRRTSNGEIYDKEALTCAHRWLPFGSYLLVRSLDTGSSVVVRVNDRGPFAKDRILDLSEAAARLVGMVATGTARVSFSLLPPEEALAWKGGKLEGAPAPSVSRNAPPVSGDARATAHPAPAPAAGPGAATAWRIQVASYRDEANARATLERLRAAGLEAAVEAAGAYRRVVFAGLDAEGARRISARLDALGYRGYSVASSTPR